MISGRGSGAGSSGGSFRRRARRRISRGSVKLSGASPPVHRVRAGSFRIVYAVRDNVLLVLVVAVGEGKSVYGAVRRRSL